MQRMNGTNVGNSLKAFVNDYGAPNKLTYDGALVQTGRNTLFQETLSKYDIRGNTSGVRRPNQNPAEGAIREVKKKWYRLQQKKQVPDRLWDLSLIHI